MKKIFIGLCTLTLLSSAAIAEGGKKVVKAKAKVECGKNCPETKDCHKAVKCPNKPGCVCS